MKKHKIVKYQARNMGLLKDGSFINAYLLIEENDKGLLYFPPDKNGCGCLILANRIDKGYYKSEDFDDNYVNLSGYKFLNPDFKRFLKSEFKTKDLKT